MSADAWKTCPRCAARVLAAHAQAVNSHQEALEALYGKVPADEYMAAVEDGPPAEPDDIDQTFREDYEIYFVDQNGDTDFSDHDLSASRARGVRVSYSGVCQACHLKVVFQHSEPIQGMR